MKKTGPLPTNDGTDPDKKMRKLDCAVLNWFLAEADATPEPFETVRGGFHEGAPIFAGSRLMLETHIQVCVRNPGCILGCSGHPLGMSSDASSGFEPQPTEWYANVAEEPAKGSLQR